MQALSSYCLDATNGGRDKNEARLAHQASSVEGARLIVALDEVIKTDPVRDLFL